MSQRLPGKVLRPLLGRPMIAYSVDALRNSRAIDGIILATSDSQADDSIEEFAQSIGVACHRGPLEDVAGRLLAAGRVSGAGAIVRVSGDSPLLDPALVDRAVDLYRQSDADIVTNVFPRSFPKGQSVEVIAIDALARVVRESVTAAEKEHVTTHIYANADQFAIESFTAERSNAEVQLSVDTAEDLTKCERILRVLGKPPWEAGWQQCVAAARAIDVERQPAGRE